MVMMTFAASSTGLVIAIAVPVLVLLATVLVMVVAGRLNAHSPTGHLSRETVRADRTRPRALPEARRAIVTSPGTVQPVAAPAAPPATWIPPDPEALGATRRQFLNRSIVNAFAIGITGFGAASLAFLWPGGASGFGSVIRVGKLVDVEAKIADGSGFAYYPEGRMWITEYPAGSVSKARPVYPPSVVAGMEHGVVALYQKCPHLGCRVPSCVTSQWFECPCHGSQYNRVGEKKGGPAPRGMDRFPVEVSSDIVSVDTGSIILGPPIGTNTTGQEAEGPHCVGGTHE